MPSVVSWLPARSKKALGSAVRVASRRDALVLASSPVAVFVRACILVSVVFLCFAGAAILSRVVQSLASVRVTRSRQAVLKVLSI